MNLKFVAVQTHKILGYNYMIKKFLISLYLFLGESRHLWYIDIHPQRLLTSQKVVKLSIVVFLTVQASIRSNGQ